MLFYDVCHWGLCLRGLRRSERLLVRRLQMVVQARALLLLHALLRLVPSLDKALLRLLKDTSSEPPTAPPVTKTTCETTTNGGTTRRIASTRTTSTTKVKPKRSSSMLCFAWCPPSTELCIRSGTHRPTTITATTSDTTTHGNTCRNTNNRTTSTTKVQPTRHIKSGPT